MADPFGTDLRLVFSADGAADLALADVDGEAVSGLDNLRQALTVRLLIDRGELAGLGHPRYGCDLRRLLGEPLDRANLELLRRYVRRALLDDPRVAEILSVTVAPRPPDPTTRGGGVDVLAVVQAISGDNVPVQIVIDA